MDEKTRQNLKNAISGESQAHMKYNAFFEAAKKEGKANVARLFKAIAFAEEVHAFNHLKVLGSIGSTVDNLSAAMAGEIFEVEKMYPEYYNEAKAKNEEEAVQSFGYALAAEKIHAEMYQKAKETVLQGKDLEIDEVYVCSVCGHTREANLPENCPVCGVKKELFKKF